MSKAKLKMTRRKPGELQIKSTLINYQNVWLLESRWLKTFAQYSFLFLYDEIR